MTIDLAAGIKDMLENPHKTGIGASINNVQPKVYNDSKSIIIKSNDSAQKTSNNKSGNLTNTATNNTNKTKTTSTTKETKTVSSSPSKDLSISALSKQIFGDKSIYIKTIADDMMQKTINDMIKEQIRKGTISVQTSKIGKAYSTAYAYYKKLYDGSIIMKELRNKTEKNIAKTINKSLNDKIAKWQNGLPNWQKKILANSKIMSTLTTFVNNETQKVMQSLFSDTFIKNVNDVVLKNLKKIKDSIQNTISTGFKKQIEQLKELRSKIQERIKVFMEMKEKYEKKIMDTLNQYKEKLAEAIKQFTDKLVNDLKGKINISVGEIKL